MAVPFYQVSGDAQSALTEFSTQFDQALALTDPVGWARLFGLVNSSRAIQTTYPIPVSAAGYVERKGDDKLRALYEKSVSMKPKEWVDGVAEKAYIVEAPDFIGWAGEPARIAREGARQPNLLIADMLAANPVLEFDGKALFADDHPVNIFDGAFSTFDNDQAAVAVDTTFLKAAKQRFRARKGPNGRVMGLQMTHLLVPAAREEEARDLLENDLIVQAVTEAGQNVAAAAINNRMKGSVTLVVAPELASDDYVYCLDGNAGCYPWIVQDGGSPEEIVYDKTSELYKNAGKIGVKYVLLMAAAAALPHAIERVHITG